MNTLFLLMYRDASNNKSFTEVIVEGAITSEQYDEIRDHLHDGSFIIAYEIDLPTPATSIWETYGITEDDHIYTTVIAFEEGQHFTEMHTKDEPTVEFDINELVEKIKNAEWNVDAAVEYYRIPMF